MSWTQITEERFDDMLGQLPPAYQSAHGFLVGEPTCHNEYGQPCFAAFVQHRFYDHMPWLFYECDRSLTVREFKQLDTHGIALDVMANYAAEYFDGYLAAYEK